MPNVPVPSIVATIGATATARASFWDQAPTVLDQNGKQLIFFSTGPLYSENPWDTVVLAGNRLPGICTVKCTGSLQFDKQKSPQQDGAKLILHGVNPCRVDITVKIWTQEQWDRFQAIAPTFWRPANKDSPLMAKIAEMKKVSVIAAKRIGTAVRIFWPGLNYLRVSQVIVTDLGAPEDGPEPQTKTIGIKCMEFMPDWDLAQIAPSKVISAPAIPVDPRVVTLEDPPSKTGVGPEGPNFSE